MGKGSSDLTGVDSKEVILTRGVVSCDLMNVLFGGKGLLVLDDHPCT